MGHGESWDVLEPKAGEQKKSLEALQLARAVFSGLGSLIDSSGGSSSCSLCKRPLLLPRKGRAWGLSLWPGSWVAGVLSGPRTSGWKKRSCHPDVLITQIGRHLEPVMGDSPAHGELFVDWTPLGRVKSGSWHPETMPHFIESSGRYYWRTSVSNGWRTFLSISLGLCRGFPGS